MDKEILNYKENGFCKVKAFMDEKEIKNIENFLNNLTQTFESDINKYKSRFCNFTSTGTVNSLHSLEKYAFVEKILISNKFLELAKFFLEEDPKPFGSEYFAKPAYSGIAVPPHQDNYYWCLNNPNIITIWIALSEVIIENGAIYYYRGSQNKGIIPHIGSNTPGSSQYIPNISSHFDDNLKSYVKLKRGDVLIHNSLVVHGSGPNKSQLPRRGFTIRYSSKDQSVNKEMQIRYEQSLKAQLLKRGDKF